MPEPELGPVPESGHELTAGRTEPSTQPRPASLGDGLRFAFGTLTVMPVRVPRWDRAAARVGMVCAPVAGGTVGLAAGVLGAVLWLLGSGPGLAAVGGVALGAALTRGLHLDGLADVADGLGSGRPADEALRIMKRSDIGPFGVTVLLLVLLAQVAALYELYGHGWAHGGLATVLAGLVSRTALTLAARAGVPAARADGLGAAVAGGVPVRTAYGAAGTVVLLSGAVGALLSGLPGAVLATAGAVLALAAAELLLRHCRRRFGGVNGDVFGALAEASGTVLLVLLTLG
ncbi:hypothetical protein AN216_16890 [Streptomyces oceani]|uniref:Adenosylcobinamide-GDP ribazoletransferase n=1 Tax=Streptomyces oceani TaxID=1075402 RepID=A0A1E7KCU5_9ACTN|nr:hypothetical protein AN216_16890 [Streptomyces oceani]